MGKCATCGLVQITPMPGKKEIAELYHEDFDHFDPYIEQSEVHHTYFRQKLGELKRNLHDLKLLDIGCLTGILLIEAKRKGMRVVGVDISADAVKYCCSQRLKVFNGTVQSIERTLKPKSFDVVTAFQVIEHERDPLKMMKRIYLLLKRNGTVMMATPSYGGFWRKLMGKRWFGFAHPEHVVLFDFATMRMLLEKSGFRDIEIRADSPRPFPLSFAFTRGADYFPWLGWALKPIGKLLDPFDIKNPVNPWDDMLVIARKR